MRALSLTVGAPRWLTGASENGSVAAVLAPLTVAEFLSVTVLPMPGMASPGHLRGVR